MKKPSILYVAAAVLGLGSNALAGPPPRTPELVARGKVSFNTNCVACHGESGDGTGTAAVALNPRPRNFKTEPFKFGNKPDQIFSTLVKGSPGSAMVAFAHLSEEERWALTYYVLSLTPGGGFNAGASDKKATPAAKGKAKGKK